MSNLASTVLAFLFALGVLVVIHELGHYLVARLCGVKVLRFSVGFGRALLSRRFGADQTEWTLAAIPLGGYVAMLDEREATIDNPIPPADLARAFNRQPIWKRAAIVVAGPVANLLLAIALYAGLAMAGTEEQVARLGAPAENTLAARSGIRDGDRVVSVDGRETPSWDDVRWQLMQAAVDHREAELVVDSDGSSRSVGLDLKGLTSDDLKADFTDKLGITLRTPRIGIGRVEPGSAAERGGVQSGDVVLEVDNRTVDSARWLRDRIRATEGTMHLVLERDGQRILRDVVPDRVAVNDAPALVGMLGVQLAPQAEMVQVNRDLLPALRLGAQRTWDTATFALRMLGKMLVGEVSLSNLSGPVTIADYAGQTARIGLEAYVAFVAAISISIGVLNLLPIPMLDGGHLLYHLIEAFKGRPLSERFIDLTQRAGLGILVMLMAVALFNDLSRLLA
ncbi:RIP metalloprotease RseP [soil metagenome]